MNSIEKTVDDLIKAKIMPLYPELITWRFSFVKLNELRMKYEQRADAFEKNHGYRTAFFEAVLSSLSECSDEYICTFSVDFKDEDYGFGFIHELDILFFSGPLKQIKQKWGD